MTKPAVEIEQPAPQSRAAVAEQDTWGPTADGAREAVAALRGSGCPVCRHVDHSE